MSVYDNKEYLDFEGAAREYDVAASWLRLAVKQGALRAIEINGEHKLLRYDVENFVKRNVKRGYGNRVITPLSRSTTSS